MEGIGTEMGARVHFRFSSLAGSVSVSSVRAKVCENYRRFCSYFTAI